MPVTLSTSVSYLLSGKHSSLALWPLAPQTPRQSSARPNRTTPYHQMFQPEEPTDLPAELLVSNLRRARKGSAQSLRLVGV